MWSGIRSFFSPPMTADPAEVTAKLHWVVRLRWLAITAQIISIFPALYFEMMDPDLLPTFSGAIGLLVVWNLLTWFALQRDWELPAPQILIQLCVDIAVLSTLLALTGGAWNPTVPILFVHSVLGAMLLQGGRSFAFFLILLLSVIVIQFSAQIPPALENSLLPRTILFPAQFLVALVFWILTAWLSRTLSTLQTDLSTARERKTRIDRLRAVGALAAGLSHEFATPLNTAQLRLGRLARSQGLEDNADLVTAREELKRCGEVLRHMAGSQLDPERLSLEVADIDMLVSQVCRGIRNDHEEGVTIRYHATGRGPYRALIPSVAFSQGVINLIDNAIQSGGENCTVDVVVEGTLDHVDLSVADRGAGWPAVVRNHLGEPFVTTKPGGVGLGLYYVHSLSEAIGAALLLEDRPDGGAIAKVSLPRPPRVESPGGEA
ncbi:MAG: HAMP domain-containing sensor histidine kinase [Myxococcota bacterium]|nr:HAMP domain-containing sensor histidine kinase [Myxococcota bacterium]